MKCPYCGKSTEDNSVFCEFCGKKLDPAAGAAINSAGKSVAGPPLSGSFNLRDAANAMIQAAKKREHAFPEEPDGGGSRCTCLHVEYAVNRFLLAGAQMPLEIRIRIDSREVKQVLLWLVAAVGGKEEICPVPTDELRFEEFVPLVIPYYLRDPSIRGMFNATFYFGCIFEHEIRFYQMAVRHTVYAKGESKQSIIANISADGGSVVDMSSLKSLADSSSNGDILIERANNEPARYKAMPLTETVWRPERCFVSGHTYVCDMLTLEWGGVQYHICGKDTVKLGRKSELNDFSILDWENAGNDHEWPNNTVSRRHAQIHYCIDTAFLTDSSSFGTFIDGIKSEIADKSRIPLPATAEIRMGDIALQMEMQRCEQRPEAPVCKNCMAGKVKAVTLFRKDALPEVYLMIWQCCDLGKLDRKLEGFTVFRRNGGFIIRKPDGNFTNLIPNETITYDNMAIEVKTFKQHGF